MSDYTKQDWKDGTDGGTPITAARLAHIEDGIAGHTHAASDVTSGTLSADRLPTVPIAHGGTGATTAAAALANLGAASASELATVRDSVSQYLHVECISLSKAAKNDSCTRIGSVTAPKVSGYSFLAWLYTNTVGWVGACYFENPLQATSGVWCVADATGTGDSTQCFALYTKTVQDSVSHVELMDVTSVTLYSYGSTDSPRLGIGFHLASGYEFRVVFERSTIHLDRYDPSGSGEQMWSKQTGHSVSQKKTLTSRNGSAMLSFDWVNTSGKLYFCVYAGDTCIWRVEATFPNVQHSVSQKVSVLSSGNAISAAEVYSTNDNPVTIRLTLENGRTAYLYSKADGTVFGRMDSQDSVSRFNIFGRVHDMKFSCDDTTDSKITMQVTFTDGNWWAINFTKGGIFLYDYATNTSSSVKLAQPTGPT